MPKYVSSIPEGNLIHEYYDEVKEHDVIFIGDCEVFSNFSPVTLWTEYGITSYIRGSAEQLIWQSYYLLEETFKYEKPKVVVFNVLSMKNNKPHKESYNRLTLDGMKLSGSKLRAIKASMLHDEEYISYIFPILRYHSRWSELSSEDFKYVFKRKTISHNGYLMRTDIKPMTKVPEGKELPDYQFDDICYDYLDKITKICKENGSELILIKAPSMYPYWYDEWDEQIVKYANDNNLKYINFLKHIDDIKLDFTVDTYDAGLHLNVTGAEKLTKYFGKILSEDYKLEDKKDNAKLKSIWDKKIEFYENSKNK